MSNNLNEHLLNTAATISIFQKLGFEQASASTLAHKLRNVRPSGGTNLRDAIMFSTGLMIELNKVVETLHTQHWNFVHIILTDGEDTGSKTSFQQLGGIMGMIGMVLNVSSLKTEFIGVGLDPHSRAGQELAAIAVLGGENADIYNVDTVDIERIFQRISLNVGLLKTQVGVGVTDGRNIAVGIHSRVDPVLMVQAKRYCCLFTLDISGSMAGGRWDQVCRSVAQFIRYLGPEDLVGAVVFNERPMLVINPNEVMVRIPANPNQPQPHNQNAQVSNTCNSDMMKKFFALLILGLVIFLVLFLVVLR